MKLRTAALAAFLLYGAICTAAERGPDFYAGAFAPPNVGNPTPVVVTDANGNTLTVSGISGSASGTKVGNPTPVVLTDANGNVLALSNGGSPSNAVKYLNKVIFVDQFPGATADLQFANACAALPVNGGVLDARGFGGTFQIIAATVSCGGQFQPVTFLFDPATFFQPSTSSTNMFQVTYNNVWDGLLHIDTSNQASYSGNAIQLPPNTLVEGAKIRAWVVMTSGATGTCFTYNTTGSSGVALSDFDIRCTNMGTAASAVLLSTGGTAFFNGNRVKLTVDSNAVSTAPKYCVNLLVTASGAGIGGNSFDVLCEFSNISTSLAAVHMNTVSAFDNLGSNRFAIDAYDIQGTNQAVIVDSGNVCGNYFMGLLGNGTGTAVTDNTTCPGGNEYHDLLYFSFLRTGSGNVTKLGGPVTFGTTNFAGLGTVLAAGTLKYCTDCTTATTCAGAGTGHLAISNGTNWTCQ